MPVASAARVNSPVATSAGLVLALFGLIAIKCAINWFSPSLTLAAALSKEGLMWISAAGLLAIIRRGEHLPFSSIGMGAARWWKSIVWGIGLAIPCLLVGAALAGHTGYGHNQGAAAFEKLPLWLITAIVIRAGVVEEFFYRGYAITRLQLIGLGKVPATVIPLLIFSLGHWSGGFANIMIAFALGLILTGFYLWRGDLTANMIGHGLVDFVANVLPKLFS